MTGTRRALWVSLLASTLVGMFVGSGLFTFFTAHGTSYISNDPSVCVNCHVMRGEFQDWQHASHHAVSMATRSVARYERSDAVWSVLDPGLTSVDNDRPGLRRLPSTSLRPGKPAGSIPAHHQLK